MRLLTVTFSLLATLLLAMAPAQATVNAQAKQPAQAAKARHAFPKEIKGFDFGVPAIQSTIKNKKLSGEDVLKKVWKDLPHFFLVDFVLRLRPAETKTFSDAARAADKIHDEFVTRSKRSDFFDEVDAWEKQGLTEKWIRSTMLEVIKGYSAEEVAAMLVKMGYHETWILKRIQGKDKTSKAFKEIAKLRKGKSKNYSKAWKRISKDMSDAELLDALYHLYDFDLRQAISIPTKFKLVTERDKRLGFLLEANNMKHLAMELKAEKFDFKNLKSRATSHFSVLLSVIARSSALSRFRSHLYEEVNAIGNRHSDIKYSLKAVFAFKEPTFIDVYANDKWKKDRLRGMSTDLAKVMARTSSPSGKFVIMTDKSVRAEYAGAQWRGSFDEKAGTIVLNTPESPNELKLKGVKIYEDGLAGRCAVENGTKVVQYLALSYRSPY